MLTVYVAAMLLVSTIAVARESANGNPGPSIGYILLMPVFFRALGWL